MDPLPCTSFAEALNAVENGQAKMGMIPIENNLAGRVADMHHLLPHTKLFIIGEYFLPIHFCLIGLKGTKKSDITTVYSHIHALNQCRTIITNNKWEAVGCYDTAGAAKYIKEEKKEHNGALAPALAAQIYDLEILEKNVEDRADNITRFVIVSKSPPTLTRKNPEEKITTTLLFRVRNVPAALYKALGGFATNNVNLTKLESYQLGSSFRATQFLADIAGHPDDPMVKLALEELNFFSEEVRILGFYLSQKHS